MIEALLIATTISAAAGAIFGLLIFVQGRISEPLSRDAIVLIVKEEFDGVRASIDDQGRLLRQELNDNLNNFQEVTITLFDSLGQQIAGKITVFEARLDAGMKSIDSRAEAIAEKLNTDIDQMRVEANANRDALRQSVESKLEAATSQQSTGAKELREELNSSFDRLKRTVAETLELASNQQKERLDANAQALTALSEKNEKALEGLRVIVDTRLETIRQENAAKLEEMRATVDEKLQTTLETRLGESFNRVLEQLVRVHEGIGEMKNLAANVGDLKNVLTNVKVRGAFGEAQVAMLLEQFLSPEQFIKNAQVKESTSERVEYAIKFPGSSDGKPLLVPIDAKFPRETYERLLAASDNGDVEHIAKLRKELKSQVRNSAKEIREKYINPPTTTDFAVMFLPVEGLYAEVLREPGVMEELQRDFKVILSGPATLSALLGAFQMGFRTLALQKRSSEVWDVLSAVRTEFGKYNTVVEKIAKQLNTAANSVTELGTRTKVMTTKLRGVELMDDNKASTLLGLADKTLDSDEVEAIEVAQIASEILVQNTESEADK